MDDAVSAIAIRFETLLLLILSVRLSQAICGRYNDKIVHGTFRICGIEYVTEFINQCA
jgi:hypothetical protein